MHICLIGCGKMGTALLEGWSNLSVINQITVVEPNKINVSKNLKEKSNIFFYNHLSEIKFNDLLDLVILAVKPQIMEIVLLELKKLEIESSCWLTIAAGLPIKFYENILGKNQSIVRTIPNTPASILKGVTALCYNENCKRAHIENSNLLMEAVGIILQVEDERLMDSITAVSGSGPAYIFYMIEAMINAAINIGIDKDDAIKLVEGTLVGSAFLLKNSEEEVSKLRKAVTSPNGTTEAGLSILSNNDSFFNLIRNAIEGAQKRGKELGKL